MFFRALMYFGVWGVIYGTTMGALAGTGIFPVFGTGFGAVFGFIAGLMGGVAAAVAAVFFNVYRFDEDTDLEQHRRRVARQVGLSVAVFMLAVSVFFGRGLLLFVLPWSGLASAYAAHRYPDVLVRERRKGKRGPAAEEMAMMQPPVSVWHSLKQMYSSVPIKWRMLIGLVAGLGFQLMRMVDDPSLSLSVAPHFLVAALGGVLLQEFVWAYITSANATLLTFLKRLVLQDYFPHVSRSWHRGILTAVAFVFTLMICWWMLFYAPLVALVAAYGVYHSLGLPDTDSEKAKRKEKGKTLSADRLALSDDTMSDDEPDAEEPIVTLSRHSQ